ncbi:MAG TPA: SDR family oxidoreductase [Candidatus Pullichristensenella stercorigallinarum]|uniref:SDR family oxidoreductase n=1 Tax=Candidatus Pullichristensenella stercorigallinarum TaxID=2840909 RepID=A0A9D1CW44_9FIRM|nr:SDR family oxidoreductase [Candidatus Pullichristensenella stercorigallinarum]
MLRGKTALVTGAGGGIGREIAVRIKAAGANVAICGRNAEKLRETALAIGGALELPGDLLDVEYAQSCVDKTAAAFGGLDILVNNAGVALSKPFEETSLEEFERVMDTNVRAPFVVSQRALPYLRRAQGRIINIASVVAHKGYPLQSAYAASKHALLGLSKSMANELYKDGVRVHVVSPGGVYTDMAKVARPDLEPDGLITAGEIAGTVMFLLSLDKNAVVDEICLHRQGKEPFA